MKSDEDWLSEAVDLSENGDFGAALGKLLQHYQAHPSLAVAEKITCLGELAASQLHDRDPCLLYTSPSPRD